MENNIELKNNKPHPNAVKFCDRCRAVSPDAMGYNVYCSHCAEVMRKRLDRYIK